MQSMSSLARMAYQYGGAQAAPSTAVMRESLIARMAGSASFSTNYGMVAPQLAGSRSTCVVIREDDDEDCEAHAAHLRKCFPEECRNLDDPEIDTSAFFDLKDTYIIGANVLQAAVRLIVHQNRVRKTAVVQYANKWKQDHHHRVKRLHKKGIREVFHEGEFVKHGEDFMEAVYSYLKSTTDPPTPLTIGEILTSITLNKSTD